MSAFMILERFDGCLNRTDDKSLANRLLHVKGLLFVGVVITADTNSRVNLCLPMFLPSVLQEAEGVLTRTSHNSEASNFLWL